MESKIDILLQSLYPKRKQRHQNTPVEWKRAKDIFNEAKFALSDIEDLDKTNYQNNFKVNNLSQG